MIYYDLHMHSNLSPCANDDMTPNNIVNMAIIKGLDLISVTDHNSLEQQRVIKKVADLQGIKYLYGVEIESIEGIHILAYFSDENQLDKTKNFLSQSLPYTKNIVEYFGEQFIYDELDQVIDFEENLLIQSTTNSLKKILEFIKEVGGVSILAHIYDRKNSITNQLGFIPSDILVDGFEVKNLLQKERAYLEYPFLKPLICLISSDAHRLIDISEKENYIDQLVYNMLTKGD